jgi:hypothetical protein
MKSMIHNINNTFFFCGNEIIKLFQNDDSMCHALVSICLSLAIYTLQQAGDYIMATVEHGVHIQLQK